MLKEKKIGETEAIALLVTNIATKVYLTTPAVYMHLCENAAWIMVLISGLVSLAFFWFILKYVEFFPEKNLSETAEKVLGPFFGNLIILLVLLLVFLEVAFCFRKYSEMILLVALPEIDIAPVLAVFLVSCAIATYLGAATIAGAAYISFPFALSAVAIICLCSFHLWNSSWMFPVLSKSMGDILLAGVLRSSDYVELIFLYCFADLFYPKQIKSIGVKSIGISTLIFLVVMWAYNLSFPSTVGQENYLPLYTMARNIYLGRFVQRIEAIFVLFWVVSGCIWLSVGFFINCKLLSDMLKLPDFRPLIPAMAILVYSAAIIPQSLPDTILYSDYYLRNYSAFFAFGVPALLIIIAILRGKVEKNDAKK